MPKLTEEVRAALKAKHPDLTVLSSPSMPGHEFAFRRCGAVEFDAFLVTVSSRDVATKVQAHRQLAGDLLVFPDGDTWRQLCDDLPGLAHTFGNELAHRAGLDADVVVGKG
jgi:hypothetical protein